MAALGSQSIASSYEQLLHVDADGGGNSTTHVSIKDGDNGTTFGFTIASDALMMSSTNRLEFGDTGTYIHQSADGVLDLVSDTEIEINATTVDMNGALDVSGATQLNSTLTVGADDTGYDVIFYGDTASSNMTWDTSEDDLVLNDSRLLIDQDDNVTALYIDTEATTANAIYVAGNTATTASIIMVDDADALTTGNMLKLYSNASNTDSRNLVYIINDHASSSGAKCLNIQQDADQVAALIDQNGNNYALEIDSEATTSSVVMIQAAQNTTGHILNIDDADQLTTGSAIMIKSNSDDNSTRNLVHVINEHASADNTVGLLIQQDGADASIELTGNGSIKFPGTQGASSDANSLDDYEEGTWTPIVSIDTSAITNSGGSVAASGKYTKVGNLVHLQMTYVFGSSISFPAGTYFRISGMPFTIDQQNYSPMLHGNYEDEGANVYGGLVTNIASSTIYMKKDDGTNWSASVPITWANGDQIGLIGTHLV